MLDSDRAIEPHANLCHPFPLSIPLVLTLQISSAISLSYFRLPPSVSPSLRLSISLRHSPLFSLLALKLLTRRTPLDLLALIFFT